MHTDDAPAVSSTGLFADSCEVCYAEKLSVKLDAECECRCPAPCSACCHEPLIRQHNGMWTCGTCGREWQSSDRYWCAWCGTWGDHQSGWCKEMDKFHSANTTMSCTAPKEDA